MFESSWHKVSLHLSDMQLSKLALIHNATSRLSRHLLEMSAWDRATLLPYVTADITTDETIWRVPIISFSTRLRGFERAANPRPLSEVSALMRLREWAIFGHQTRI